jgi:ABC-type sugar transport system substrate-binding protein
MKTTRISTIMTGLVAASLFVTGCAAEAESSSATSSGAGGSLAPSADRHATVLDDMIADLDAALPALSVQLPDGTKVAFEEGEKLRVAFIGYGKGFDYSVPEYEAIKEVGQELGIEVDEYDPAGSAQTQVSQLQHIASSGKYNAVIAYPISPDLSCDLMTRQMPQEGIITVAVGNAACTNAADGQPLTTIPDTGPTDFVYPAWAHEIGERSSEGSKAIVLTGPELDVGAKMAGQATETIFPEYGVEVLSVVRTDFTQADSLQKVQDALQSNPDATMVVSSYPEGTQAALAAVRAAGATDRIRIYDFGAEEPALDALAEGQVAGSTPFYSYTKIKTALQALQLARHAVKVEEYIPYSGHAVESIRSKGDEVMFITPENVDQFRELVAD